MTPYEHIQVKTNGIQLHAVQAGPANGPLVILLHGFPEFWYGWRHQISALAEAGCCVVAPDQRGYNLSDKPKNVSAYSVDELTRDVTGLLDSRGNKQCFLAGHDWGAAVAWETAIRYPERVRKLVILNVPHVDVMKQTIIRNWRQLLKSWYIFYFQVPFLPELALRSRNYSSMRRMLRLSGRHNTFSGEDLDEYVRAWSQPGALTSMINWYRAIFRKTLHEPGSTKNPPRRVRVPTLILWGMHDVALSSTMAQPSLELCDQGRLVFFERASHFVQHDEAEAVTQKLIDFFDNES